MSVQTRPLSYEIDGQDYEATLASASDTPKPGVIICHTWAGRSEFEDTKATALAKLGLTGVAIDLYGKGVLGKSNEENQVLLEPWVADRKRLQTRLSAILDIVKDQPEIDADKMGAIGFCFGGLCVLDIARAGENVKGVVSFHGLLGAPGNTVDNISAKVLALHGWADPMAPPSDVVAFGEEMTKANADWQLHGYGGVLHAFTNPHADDIDFGVKYDADADRRSWQAMQNFFAEIFK